MIDPTENDTLLKENFKSLYIFNQVYLFGHILIGLECLLLRVPEMVLLNLCSVLWFLYNGFRMKRTELSRYNVAEFRMTFEIILHQFIAFVYMGTACGFHFILLSCSCSLFTLYKTEKSTRQYYIKALSLIILFIFIESMGTVYTPIYTLPANLTTLWKATIIAYSFAVSTHFTLRNYNNVTAAMENFKKDSNKKSERIQQLQKEVIIGLANVIESRDGETGEHTKRTAAYVEQIARELQAEHLYTAELTEEFVENLRMAAPLHDIVKIKVPDAVLQKPGPLTPEEFSSILKHTVYGGEIIRTTINNIEDPAYSSIAYNVAMYHHERYDGKGYPEGLSRQDIPLEARIMAVADVYDALTADRCYKKSLSKETACRMLREGSGTQFDPAIVGAFLKTLERS